MEHHEFTPLGGRRLLDEIARAINRGSIYFRRDHPILFVCGGPVEPDADSMRAQFIAWAKNNLPGYTLLLAEDAFRSRLLTAGSEKVGLSEFEDTIGDISDGVVLFPESTGSFAEMGYFAASETVRDKLLIVNDFSYQTSNSFASLGPIQTIDAKSYLAPTVHVQKDQNGLADFTQLPQRLERVTERLTSRAPIPRVSYTKLTRRQRLASAVAMLSILRAATFWGLYAAIRAAFKHCNKSDLKHLLSITIAAGYVRAIDDFVYLDPVRSGFVEFDGVDPEPLRARALYYHQRYVPRAYAIITER
jgi:hypothetical protein